MLQFFFCLLITVSIHELAHMLVALKCGIGVKAFSIGFGKPYLHKTIKGIDYRLSPLPLGGYCDIKGMESNKDKDDFLSHRYLHKFAVLIAGVTANLLLACGVYLFHYGSISIGLQIDWIFLKAMFSQDYTVVEYLFRNVSLNFFLIQLSVLNLFCGVTNILPIPALDGGHLWLVLMERFWKEKFVKRYTQITKYGFVFLIVLQAYIIYWIYFGQ
jgi:membrane-associated protease RseP (regulator of RpoE activity)